MRWLLVLGGIPFAMFLAGCGVPMFAASPTPTPTCEIQASTFVAQIQSLAREWDDANKLAGQTPRASLSSQISNLQSIRRRVQDLRPLPCTENIQQHLIKAMDSSIQAYLDFLEQRSEAVVSHNMKVSEQELEQFGAAIRRLIPGATSAAVGPTLTPIPEVVSLDRVPVPLLIERAGELAPGLRRSSIAPGRVSYYTKLGIPPGTQDLLAQFTGIGSAFVVVSLFDGQADRDAAYRALAGDIEGRSLAGLGERAEGDHTEYKLLKTTWDSLVFERCDAVVHMRAENVPKFGLDDLVAYAKRLDSELQRGVCRR